MKWFAAAVCAVHWFNPLSYYILKRVDEECEISCDLAATRGMNADEKSGYMRTVLKILSETRSVSGYFTTRMAGEKKTIIDRFTAIREYGGKRPVVLSVTVAAVCVTGALICAGVIIGGMDTDGNDATYEPIMTVTDGALPTPTAIPENTLITQIAPAASAEPTAVQAPAPNSVASTRRVSRNKQSAPKKTPPAVNTVYKEPTTPPSPSPAPADSGASVLTNEPAQETQTEKINVTAVVKYASGKPTELIEYQVDRPKRPKKTPTPTPPPEIIEVNALVLYASGKQPEFITYETTRPGKI